MGCTPLPGNARMERQLGQMAVRARDPLLAMAATLESYHKIEAERFDREGPNWKQLADSTVATRGGSDHPILQRTGTLYDSFAGHSNVTETITSHGWRSVSDVAYAGYHQHGGDVPGHPPQRKIVDINPQTVALWLAIIWAYIMHGQTRTGSSGEIAWMM
jgi:phage gpG-like protein